MSYISLKILSYEHVQEYEVEQNNRLNNPAAIRTNLTIVPYSIQQQRRLPEERYSLFCILLPEIVRMKDDVFLNSRQISEHLNSLPLVAREYFIVSQLIEEVQNTNLIEGVKSTRKEVADAYRSDAKIRFNGIVTMYKQILRGQLDRIDSPEEFREIYDNLLLDEIHQDDLPDGKWFRTQSVYVSDGDHNVHQGDPDETAILLHLNDLIDFMNDSRVPIIIKAILTHYYFEYIHPFYDGNGRMGRYLFSSNVARQLDILTGLSLASGISQNKKIYESAFIEASHPKNKGEMTFFVRDLLEIILTTQRNLIDTMSVSRKRLDKALEYLESQEYSREELNVMFILVQSHLFKPVGFKLSNNEIAEVLNISRYKVDGVLKSLAAKGSAEQIGKKPVSYKLTNDLLRIIE